LFSTNIQTVGKRIVFLSLILIVSSFVALGIAPDTNISENNPVLEVTNSTNTSVSLSWYQTSCVVECNTYHLTYFERYELYQKSLTEENYLLVFTSTNIRVTAITLSKLIANSTYSFFLILIWDWSNLNPEIADTYGGNKISNVITIDLSNQVIKTTQINHLSTNTLFENERTIKQIDLSYSIIIIGLITVVLLFQKRKKG